MNKTQHKSMKTILRDFYVELGLLEEHKPLIAVVSLTGSVTWMRNDPRNKGDSK